MTGPQNKVKTLSAVPMSPKTRNKFVFFFVFLHFLFPRHDVSGFLNGFSVMTQVLWLTA